LYTQIMLSFPVLLVTVLGTEEEAEVSDILPESFWSSKECQVSINCQVGTTSQVSIKCQVNMNCQVSI